MERHPTTERIGIVVGTIEEAVNENGIGPKTAAVLLAHNVAIVRGHDGQMVEIDHDPQSGPQLVLRYHMQRDNEIELTLEPEPTRPRAVETSGVVDDADTATHKATVALLKKIANESRWSDVNPEGHNVEDLSETYRHAIAAKNTLEKWLERTREAPRGETPPGNIALSELVLGLRDAAGTTLRAGWKRNDDRGHPTQLELTVFGRERQRVALTRYQRGDRVGRNHPVEAVGDERKGWATVVLTEIGQTGESVVRCSTMELIDSYDEQTRRRSSRWLKKHSWERLLRNVALNCAWRDAAQRATGADLCEQLSWYRW